MSPHDYRPEAFIKALGSIDRSKSMGEKFRDFCEMAYCAFAKKTAESDERADELEERYMKVVGTYRNKDDVREYPKLLAMTVMGVQDGLDYLGTVSSQLEILNPKQGQFFTPMPVSQMMAEMLLGNLKPQIEQSGYVSVGEPAAGAGGMVIACANVVRRQGFSPNIHLFAYAADVSYLAYQMCFLQLSITGVAAYVEHANSLSQEHFDGAWTLAAYVFREFHGHTHFDRPHDEADAPQENVPVRLRQLSLF